MDAIFTQIWCVSTNPRIQKISSKEIDGHTDRQTYIMEGLRVIDNFEALDSIHVTERQPETIELDDVWETDDVTPNRGRVITTMSEDNMAWLSYITPSDDVWETDETTEEYITRMNMMDGVYNERSRSRVGA